jgi:hypothetical protein
MAQKVFARMQGNTNELQEAEQERKELKEWERQAAVQAKEVCSNVHVLEQAFS